LRIFWGGGCHDATDHQRHQCGKTFTGSFVFGANTGIDWIGDFSAAQNDRITQSGQYRPAET